MSAPRRTRRAAAAALLAAAGGAWVLAVQAPPSSADPAPAISGYSADVQALGAQIAFNIPGVVPLPDQNLLEEDVPFARTQVSAGPVVNALGAPYYPGDILANMGSLLAEFAPPGAPSVPNDPLLAMADYPPAPGHGQDASFGGTPPPGVPLAPDVFSAVSHADGAGGRATATLTDVAMSAPSSTTSLLASLGAPLSAAGPLGGVLGSVRSAMASPGVDVGSMQSTNAVAVTSNAVTASAGSILRSIDVAGVLDISQLTSSASSSSDGTTGTPSATLHLAGVTAEGQPAYIDQQGVHVSAASPSSAGMTPAQAQQALDTTLAQDGITVRLADPVDKANGPEASADAGGLVITVSHAFAVPYIPGEPSIPVPVLGNTNLPAGVYQALTSLTLGAATTDASAARALPFADGGGASTALGAPGATSPIALGIPSMSGLAPTAGVGGATNPGDGGAPAGTSQALGAPPLAGASHRLPLGLPVPVAWVLAGLVLCVLVTYPMLLTVRWQFLGRSRR
jgi:hypothetical protein